MLTVWVTSCSYPVEFIPESEDKIIIQSEFKSGEDIKIHVYKGIGFPDLDTQPYVPDSASIKVLLDGRELQINRIDSIVPYYLVRSKNEIGEDYRLEVDFPFDELAKASAQTYIPFQGQPSNFELKLDSSIYSGDDRYTYLSLTFDIEGENPDKYFELNFPQIFNSRDHSPNDTIWHPASFSFLTSQDENLLVEGISWSPSRESFLIEYYKLEKKRITLNLLLKEFKGELLSKVQLQLKTHNREGFEFLQSYEKSLQNYHSDFPVLVSNIENGIGVFTAFSTYESWLVIDHN